MSVWQAEGDAQDFFEKHNGVDAGVTYAPGQFGRAFHFDGSSFVEIEPAESLRPEKLTILAYVKADAPPGPIKYIVSQGAKACDAASYGLYTGLSGGLVFYIWDGVNNVNWSPDAGVGIWDGKYHFVAGTYDGQTVRLYVDGNEVGSGTPAPGPIQYFLPNKYFYIGSYNPIAGCSMGFTGEIDEVILLKDALSSAEVHGLLDSDGDGLPDDWEEFGLADDNGNLLVDLPALGANKFHKDIFLQIDYMDCMVEGGDCELNPSQPTTHSHRPKQAAIDMVTQAFRDAPVRNPDSTTGIALHVEVGKPLQHQNSMRPLTTLNTNGKETFCGDPNDAGFEFFRDIKQANFDDFHRGHVYHYAVFAHQQKSYDSPPAIKYQMSSGCAELPGNDFYVTLGGWNTICVKSSVPGNKLNSGTVRGGDDMSVYLTDADGVQQAYYVVAGHNGICETTAAPGDIQAVAVGNRPPADIDGDGKNDRDVGTVLQQAGTLMHELGHNLGLKHGGEDQFNYKPNYLSVMNYAFQTSGVTRTNPPDGTVMRIDYSREELPTLVEKERVLVPPDFHQVDIGLDETLGISDGWDNTKWFCPNDGFGIRDIRIGRVDPPIDWNCNRIIETSAIADINGDNLFTALQGFDDWQNLRLDFQNTKLFSSGAGWGSTVTEEMSFAEALQVPQIARIDIKPGNVINPGTSGVIPVAILSDALFDATQVDPLSVRFGPGEATEVHGRGHLEDVNGDGRLDLVLHFATKESGITCGQTSVTLTGSTEGGQSIQSSEDITTVGCK